MNFSEDGDYNRILRFSPEHTRSKQTVDVRFAGTEIQHVEHLKYLGVTLDHTLTYNAHLTKRKSKKVSALVNIVQKLAGKGWGAGAETLRTAALAIVYSTAECCPPVWLNSVPISKIDVHLNNAMCIIIGCIKPTQLPWIPKLAHIAPPKLRRKAAAIRELVHCRRHANSLLYEQLLDIHTKVGVPSTYLDNGGVFNDGTIQHFWGLDRLLVGGAACKRLSDS
jgi:hypothetical protein